MESDVIQALQTIANNIQAASQPGWVEYVSIGISFFSVLLSVLAIIFAVRVPKIIADRQDKISLFEKRYYAYSSLLTIQSFARALDKEFFKENTPDDKGDIWHISAKVGLYCVHFATIFGYQPPMVKEGFNAEGISQTITLLKKFETDVYMLPFLFACTDAEKEQMLKEISEIFEPLLAFMTEVTSYNFKEHCQVHDEYRLQFICAANKISKKYAEKFEKELKIY